MKPLSDGEVALVGIVIACWALLMWRAAPRLWAWFMGRRDP